MTGCKGRRIEASLYAQARAKKFSGFAGCGPCGEQEKGASLLDCTETLKAGEGQNMEQFLRVGVISSTHGVRGEVKVFPTTDDSARFEELETVILNTGKESTELKIEGIKFSKKQVILKFKGYDSINEIEKYKGMDLWIPRENAVPLGENENFIADLLGMTVAADTGETLGTLVNVIQTGANDVYVVKDAQEKEILLPAIRDCILEVHVEEKRMVVHILEGLLDL